MSGNQRVDLDVQRKTLEAGKFMDQQSVRKALCTYITTEVLNSPQFALGDDEPLVTSGLIGSFALVDIALWIERNYGISISDRDLLDQKFNSVSDFANYVLKMEK